MTDKYKKIFKIIKIILFIHRVDMLKNGTLFEISTFKVNNFFISRHVFMILVLISEVTIGVF